uniref:hypothetical protein n=1 Tax=Daedalea confragosa TaxID=2028083 RepID=UPI002A7F1810|nr:hypothetical protein UYH48_mgp41 [Daedaleopsis confragosa]WNZ34381.1 hypothetical protein [Daedaleopsis confragosa]
MIYNPIYHISSFIIRFVVRRVNLPNVFRFLATSYFAAARSLMRSEGLLPTLRVLNLINREVMRRGLLSNVTNNGSLKPVIVNTLTHSVLGNWGNIIENSNVITRNYKWYIMGLLLSRFTNIFLFFFRVSIGIILSSIGIVYTTDLGVFNFLRQYAYSVIDFVQDHSTLKFYSKTPIKIIKTAQKVKENYVNPPSFKGVEEVTSNSYSLLGLILIGVFISGIALISANYFYHEEIKNVSYIGSFVDTINNGISNSYNYVKSFFISKPPVDPTNPTIISPSPIDLNVDIVNLFSKLIKVPLFLQRINYISYTWINLIIDYTSPYLYYLKLLRDNFYYFMLIKYLKYYFKLIKKLKKTSKIINKNTIYNPLIF